MSALIAIRNLVNQFGRQCVHDQLNMDIYQNEILGLVGGSGSGKSVLLRSIVGLQKPKQGKIYFNDEELTELDSERATEIKRHWGMLFQRGALFSSLTVAENIMLPMKEFSNLTKEERYEIMWIKLHMVGLENPVASKYPAELSGGMVKRVALARAMALDPEVLFLDEPTSGLDPISASEFDELIASLHKSLGLTVLMVTHDMDSLFTLCDRVAVVVDKKIIAGTLEEILDDKHPWIQEYFHSPRALSRHKLMINR
ncbi:MAG: Methionine ABC transporter ATP-binding protein [uncultured Thiotrichaceae bacterium]|uniref:Methionine ABC transporter ATP-binding protein n=1 Tax=uncultured Thiotrichaceae bacterium TaxID=298394 RepID=A0A6S6SE50_9GAMM|nr:MAG: Methionine ABC transporter ATP-binding protein [uncultured Thiotrichaceae bacterium]